MVKCQELVAVCVEQAKLGVGEKCGVEQAKLGVGEKCGVEQAKLGWGRSVVAIGQHFEV